MEDQRFAHFEQDGDALVMTAENPRAEAVRIEKDLPHWHRDFSMNTGRGIALDISGEVAWADGNWGWRFGAKHFDYNHVQRIGLGFGYLPPKSSPEVRLTRLRTLTDIPSKLVNPVITTGDGRLTVHGEIETGCYPTRRMIPRTVRPAPVMRRSKTSIPFWPIPPAHRSNLPPPRESCGRRSAIMSGREGCPSSGPNAWA